MSRYSFYVKKVELGRIQYYVKKHDLRFEGNPICFSSSKEAYVTIAGDGPAMNAFMQDVAEIEKYNEFLDKPLVTEFSMWYNIKKWFKEVFA